METHNQFVRCVENIQDLSLQGHYDYVLVLGGGGMFSRKDIEYKRKRYYVFNHIDDTKEVMTEAQFKRRFGKAMKLRCLIVQIY